MKEFVELIKAQRAKVLADIETCKQTMLKAYAKQEESFLKDASPFKIGQVVEVTGDNRKYKRIIIDVMGVMWVFDEPLIVAAGWYLNNKNVRVKWCDKLYLRGIGTQYKVSLSENQKWHYKHEQA